MRLIKLTDQKGKTRGGMTWGPGVTNVACGSGAPELCTDAVLHAYISESLAVFIYPTHLDFTKPRFWEAEGEVVAWDAGKVGCKSLTTVKEIFPKFPTAEQRISLALEVCRRVYTDENWLSWAGLSFSIPENSYVFPNKHVLEIVRRANVALQDYIQEYWPYVTWGTSDVLGAAALDYKDRGMFWLSELADEVMSL